MPCSSPDLSAAIALSSDRFTRWCREKALPLWARNNRKPSGGFYENLLMDGAADLNTPVRVRVNARQTYAYALAACRHWFAEGKTIAEQGRAYIQDHCLLAPGFDGSGPYPGMAYLLAPDDTIADGRVDLYTQAFFLLAMAWHYRATGDTTSLSMARQAVSFLDEEMASPHGGWTESLPALPGARRQNPHMHLFEAFMALYQASDDDLFLTYADQIHALFERHFYDADRGVLREFFTDDWQLHPQTGDLIEPGHMMEWCWLLSTYQGLRGMDLSTPMQRLYDEALKRGVNEKTGLLWDEMTIHGHVTKPTHRFWSLTEFIKASIALARLGNKEAGARIAPLTEQMMATYLATPVQGGWYDQYDADGKVIPSPMPASTFYHIVCAASELEDYARSQSADADQRPIE